MTATTIPEDKLTDLGSKSNEEKLKYFTASQWQLVWWRFRRNKLDSSALECCRSS